MRANKVWLLFFIFRSQSFTWQPDISPTCRKSTFLYIFRYLKTNQPFIFLFKMQVNVKLRHQMMLRSNLIGNNQITMPRLVYWFTLRVERQGVPRCMRCTYVCVIRINYELCLLSLLKRCSLAEEVTKLVQNQNC